MSNLIINRPVNQQFVQYPHWIAQGKEFSLDEAGLLSIILSFKDYLSKSSLIHFTRDGKRAIDTAWKGLIQKGILIAKSFKSADNRFAWSYTVNLEKVSILSPQKTVVNYAEIAHKYGVSEDIARAITEEAIARAIPAASLPNIPIEPISRMEPEENNENGSILAISTQETDSKTSIEVPNMPISMPEIGFKPFFEVQSMPISMPEMDFNPFFEIQSMPISILEMGSKTLIETLKMPIPTTEIDSKAVIETTQVPIPTTEISSKTVIETPKMPIPTTEWVSKPIMDEMLIEKPTLTASEKRSHFAETLLNDKKLLDYLRAESPIFEVTPEIILAFHKRLDMNQLEHSNYEKYAQHFRNWLPDFLKYQDVGNKIKTAKQNVVNDSNGSNEKCGSNKDFNILRKKLQNPQADYMTYQDWVIKLAEITENLSPADITYKNEIVSIYKKGQLRQRFQEMKAKMELVERSN